jgi:hypothetical protein
MADKKKEKTEDQEPRPLQPDFPYVVIPFPSKELGVNSFELTEPKGD